jgi:hypothetical protein
MASSFGQPLSAAVEKFYEKQQICDNDYENMATFEMSFLLVECRHYVIIHHGFVDVSKETERLLYRPLRV